MPSWFSSRRRQESSAFAPACSHTAVGRLRSTTLVGGEIRCVRTKQRDGHCTPHKAQSHQTRYRPPTWEIDQNNDPGHNPVIKGKVERVWHAQGEQLLLFDDGTDQVDHCNFTGNAQGIQDDEARVSEPEQHLVRNPSFLLQWDNGSVF